MKKAFKILVLIVLFSGTCYSDDSMFFGEPLIISATLTPAGKIEIVYKAESRTMLACYPARPAPVKIWKEIYTVKDGKIILEKKSKA